MKINYLHIIVSRVAIKWKMNGKFRHEEAGFKWENFLTTTFELYQNFAKKSLSNQSSQNFKLISLVDESVNYPEDQLLENEAVVKVSSYDKIPSEINNYLKSLNQKYQYILVTRLDRDDALDADFVKNLQLKADSWIESNPKNKKYYFDVLDRLILDTKANKFYLDGLYQRMTSPFISVIEEYGESIDCFPYKYEHGRIKNLISGEKSGDLKSLQIVHGSNLLNRVAGKKVENINLNKFGLGG